MHKLPFLTLLLALGGNTTLARGNDDAAPGGLAVHDGHSRGPTVLSAEDLAALQSDVRTRCQLEETTEPENAPWYYHYELALELGERGDDQRSVDALLEAVERRDRPGRAARTYGMWFTNYVPYFHLARAHAHLGDWECAANALALSERMGELAEEDELYSEYIELKTEAGQQHQP